jgi:transposase InsO family protein
MKVETVLVVLLGGLLLATGWQDNGRRIRCWLRRFKEQLPRHWHPKTPEACPHCRAGAAITIQKVKREVVPYRQLKSRRGKPKQVQTAGHACPRTSCVYFGIRDVAVHALVGDGKDGPHGIQRFRCQACKTTFSCRRDSALCYLKTEEVRIEMALWFLAEGIALLTRNTWSLAQSELHLQQHVGWWQAYYHLVRPHQALRLSVPSLKRRFRLRSPAMALCLTDQLWSVGEFLCTPLPVLAS